MYFNYNCLTKDNMLINKALLKYGYSNFKLEILEYCDKYNSIKREQFYINLINPNYNILKKAGSALGYKHTEEAKKKISEAKKNMTEETKKSINIYIDIYIYINV